MNAKWIKRKNLRKIGRILGEIHSEWRTVKGKIRNRIGFDDTTHANVSVIADVLNSYPLKRWNVSLPQEYLDCLNSLFRNKLKENGVEFPFPAISYEVLDFILEKMHFYLIVLDEKCHVLGKGNLKNELNRLVFKIQDCLECIERHRELAEDDCNRVVFRFDMHLGIHTGDRELN